MSNAIRERVRDSQPSDQMPLPVTPEDCPRCPLTGDTMRPWLEIPNDYRRKSCPRDFKLYWSDEGNFGQLYPRPSQEEIGESYDIDEYYTHGNSQTRVQSTTESRILRHLAWRLDHGKYFDIRSMYDSNEGKRVCDIGCGDGSILAKACESGYSSVIGIEPDPAARSVAIARGLDVREGTAEDLPDCVTRESFDVVVMSHVLEHTLDPLTALNNAASLLRKGGVLCIETPNNDATGLAIAGRHWPWLDVPRHLNFFTADSLTAFCTHANLSLQKVEYAGYCRQFSDEWLQEERLIRSRFPASNASSVNAMINRWNLLLRTAFASQHRKYDSVRVYALKE